MKTICHEKHAHKLTHGPGVAGAARVNARKAETTGHKGHDTRTGAEVLLHDPAAVRKMRTVMLLAVFPHPFFLMFAFGCVLAFIIFAC